MTDGTCRLEWCKHRASSIVEPGLCRSHARYLRTRGRLPQRRPYFDDRERLYAHIAVNAETGCWLWTGNINEHGYGTVTFQGRTRRAHRALWILERGDLPRSLDLDHLCRVRHCVNLDHLEPVVRTVNLRRGAGTRATETHCANGHLWADDNERRHLTDGSRVCATCMRDRAREYQRRKREERRKAG